ncbi:MAG TPA: hypothetical protein VJ934_00515 [Desulfomicrobiaceae bacterium]|nr:hypothetical protein [Desulfomicrobiaceae bacterium]
MENCESVFRARVRNCLQTIIELEPELEKHALGERLLDEFRQLKQTMDAIDSLELTEDDVQRIERSTSEFLEEVRLPLALDGHVPKRGEAQ